MSFSGAQVCYPKQTDKPLYHGLVTQLKSLHIPFLSAEDLSASPLKQQADVIIDSIFGFSFKGAPRPPFDKILDVSTCGSSLIPTECSFEYPLFPFPLSSSPLVPHLIPAGSRLKACLQQGLIGAVAAAGATLLR